MDNVVEFIESLNIDKNEYVIVACSGGPDSMFLLDLLNNMGYKCVAAHVNHNMREASKDEYKFLSDYCDSVGVTFEGTEITEYGDDNFHNDARIFRYNFFESLIKKYHAKYLFTAHHGDDLVETILMRLVRGSTLKGYAGFDSIVEKDGYKVIRPLIFLTKKEIEDANNKNNLKFVVDESNLEDHYTRNRYRHHVLPFLKAEESNVHLKFINFSNSLKECANYIDSIVEEKMNKIYNNGTLNIKEFLLLDTFIQKEVLSKIISYWYPDDLFVITDNHLKEVMKIIESNKANVTLNLPNGVYVIKAYDKLDFTKGKRDTESYEYVLEDSVELIDGIIKRVKEDDSTSNYVIRLNSKDIKLPLIIHSRNDGERMMVKNMDGSRKVNDIFIDSKVSKESRDSWPIVTDSDGIVLWIPGLKKSKFDIPINGLYDIILKYEKKERNSYE